QITVTEEDFNGTNYVTSNTIPDGVPFFDGIGFDDIFLENTDVIFEVDLRPAYYYIEDNGSLPSFSGEESVTTVDWLFANGPLIAGSWESWGLSQGDAESLGTAFVDDGTSGDAVAGDSIFTLTKSYSPGDEVEGAFKLGVNGYDNESDFAVDHYLRIGDSNVVEVIFGAVFNGEIVNDDVYDEYILKTEEGPVVVRSGGTEGDFVENIIVDGDFTSDVLPESWTFFEGEGA
ncbi:MAG: choice-of-anchor X domain-containing protein, partial [Gracilimonas sp.]|nr:choice-of-anchor X domain-containing protein [Gracilimonas sp.]